MRVWLQRAKIPLLFVILHVLFSLYRLLPAFDGAPVWKFFIPSVELLVIFSILYRSEPSLRGKSPRGGLLGLKLLAASAVAGVMFFHSAGEGFYRYYYSDHFHPLSDGRLLPGLFGMLVDGTGLPASLIPVVSWIVTAVILLGAGFVVSLSIRRVAVFKDRSFPWYSRLMPLVLAGIIAAALPETSALSQTALDVKDIIIGRSAANAQIAAQPVLPKIEILEPDSAAAETSSGESSAPPMSFPAIEDADIHFVVVESYGSTLYERDEYRNAIYPLYDELEGVLKSDGWIFYSGLVRSPAFGGRSWLADATLLAGEQIRNQNDFENRQLRPDPARLPVFLANAGYHRIYAAPGTSKTAEAWLRTYPFDDYLLRYDFDYQGPWIGFGTMSDQYIFDRIHRNYLFDDRREFVFYLLVSSHVPFETVPVYKPDWDFTLNGKEYDSGYLEYFDNDWLSGNELAEGYIAGITYTLETAVYYLTERLSERELMLIIGDHQPRKPVSVPGSGYPVPFHLILPVSLAPVIPPGWDLSTRLMPPDIPENENTLPEMAEIPLLIEAVITAPPDGFTTRYGYSR